MGLKEFIEKAFAENPIQAFSMAGKLLELEAIEKWLNLMYGIDLDIKVVMTEKREGRFYGKSLMDSLK